MTFEEFKELAVSPKYPDEKVIYRIDVYEMEINEIQGDLKLGSEAFLKCEYLAPNFEGVEHLIKKQVRCDIPRKRLYAIYVYELPFYKNLKNKMYRRLWVYNNKGKLISQSVCSALIEDISCSCVNFRGRLPEQIAFKPGEIVEFFDHNLSKVYPGLIVETPLSIEQCWEIQERIKQECVKEGLRAEDAYNNYYMYDTDDKYSVITLQGIQISVKPTDIFPLTESLSDDIKKKFDFNAISIEKLKGPIQQVIGRVNDYLKHKDNFTKLLDLL